MEGTRKKVAVAAVFPLYKEPHTTRIECQRSNDIGPCPRGNLSPDSPDLLEGIGQLFKSWAPNEDGPVTDDVDCEFNENGGELKGKQFRLKIAGERTWRNNPHFVRVRERDPAPYLELLKGSIFQSDVVVPIYDVEVRARSPDTVVTGMNLCVPVGAHSGPDTKYVVLQRGKTESDWSDITDKCTTSKDDFQQSMVISIPIDKSSRVWVVVIKRSWRSLVHVLLVLLLGRTLFRVLVFFKVQNRDVRLRVIGISEELYQNPSGLRTEVTIAKDAGFQLVEESDAKQLLKKGKLLVTLYLAGNCQKSVHFDVGGVNLSKVAQRGEFQLDTEDLGRIPKVAVADDADMVLWSFELKNLLNVSRRHETPTNPEEPAFRSLDEEFQEEHILWLAREVNRDWEKLAVCLEIESRDIEIIRSNNHEVEHRCSRMLELWRERKKSTGKTPSWGLLKRALEEPVVGRADIFRCLHSKGDVSNHTLLKLSHKVAHCWRKFGHSLGIPNNEIEIIDCNHSLVEEKCMALLQKWRQRHETGPTISELIDALRSPIMRRDDIANELMRSINSTTIQV